MAGLSSAAALYGHYRVLPSWLTGPRICRLEHGGCAVLFRSPRAKLLGPRADLFPLVGNEVSRQEAARTPRRSSTSSDSTVSPRASCRGCLRRVTCLGGRTALTGLSRLCRLSLLGGVLPFSVELEAVLRLVADIPDSVAKPAAEAVIGRLDRDVGADHMLRAEQSRMHGHGLEITAEGLPRADHGGQQIRLPQAGGAAGVGRGQRRGPAGKVQDVDAVGDQPPRGGVLGSLQVHDDGRALLEAVRDLLGSTDAHDVRAALDALIGAGS